MIVLQNYPKTLIYFKYLNAKVVANYDTFIAPNTNKVITVKTHDNFNVVAPDLINFQKCFKIYILILFYKH